MEWIPPKLDWNKEDYYNFEDLNRVENNIKVVASLINLFESDAVPSVAAITDRDMSAIVLASELNRIESNIEILGQRYKPEEWQKSKLDWAANMPFSYQDAIRLENNLTLLHSYYRGNLNVRTYCGTYICGEEVV